MKLKELVETIENQDDEKIIFIEDKNDFRSEIHLDYPEEGDGGVKEVQGKRYYYLLEIFLAKEFINDWLESLPARPSSDEISKRLFEYGINDA